MFEMGLIQALVPALKNENIQCDILQIYTYIIKNGWKQIQSTSQQESIQSQSNLQQLLSLPNPYLTTFETQGIINVILENILMNKDIDRWNKKKAYELLDLLYPEGIRIKSDLYDQLIRQLCEQAQQDDNDNQVYAFESLQYFVVNQDNHELIVSGGAIESAIDYIKKSPSRSSCDCEGCAAVHEPSASVGTSYNLLRSLFIHGTSQTQQQINILIQRDNLFAPFAYQDSMKQLIIIKRVVERRGEQGLVQIIKAGLMRLLSDELEKVKENEEEEILIIGDIIQQLVENNNQVREVIINETDFVDRNLTLLNSLPLDQIKEGFLSPIDSLSSDNLPMERIPYEQKNKLFSKGVIQIMTKILDCKDSEVYYKAKQIIINITIAATEGLKEQEQHPYRQQLADDGTIHKLFSLLKNYYLQEIHIDISYILAILFKAFSLPSETGEAIIKNLIWKDDYYNGFAFLTECQDNHNTILQNEIQLKLFQKENFTRSYLHITHNILKYGSNDNKHIIAQYVKAKVERLTDEQYVRELGMKKHWDNDLKEEIKALAEESAVLIQQIS
ncbi:MAG: hypothetical protein EZS28_014957 [Streblomastix strix]|uniref:Uncharacterized protein n=1 Tax=Streblomastix strix TaxID=222440 RepID=A0A5J4W3Q8_9EUKA|nr:MAG: hypothetical protein EZS28_014957 [Streblomastix strix]